MIVRIACIATVLFAGLSGLYPNRTEAAYVPHCYYGTSFPYHPVNTLLHIIVFGLSDTVLYTAAQHATQINLWPSGFVVVPNPRIDAFVPADQAPYYVFGHGLYPVPLAP